MTGILRRLGVLLIGMVFAFLTLLPMTGMADPPRPDTGGKLRKAGPPALPGGAAESAGAGSKALEPGSRHRSDKPPIKSPPGGPYNKTGGGA